MLDKLEFLLALSRERHFGRAAEACGVTQPTLSAGIKQLEQNLGVLLVHRGSRFMGLTGEGERVLAWARRLVGDARAMRDELRSLSHGLSGHLRLAVVPTALAAVPDLTEPFRARHPEVRFTILSSTSAETLTLLENLEVDAGLTYLDNEPLGRVRAVPLYRERYRLLTSSTGLWGDREQVTWAEAAAAPLCLLTPDMQNRRILDRLLGRSDAEPRPALESNSVIVLFSHVRTGRWATILPEALAATLGGADGLRAIPIVEPDTVHTIGLVAPSREPMTPLVAALVAEAERLGSVPRG